MKISEINQDSNDVEFEATCVHVSVPRQVNTKYGTTNVASATMQDETGTITLTLWGRQINAVKKGDRVKVSSGYVREYQEQLQVSVGKNGKIEVLD
jgi:ssDNA-binding replication factor A large subunit